MYELFPYPTISLIECRADFLMNWVNASKSKTSRCCVASASCSLQTRRSEKWDIRKSSGNYVHCSEFRTSNWTKELFEIRGKKVSCMAKHRKLRCGSSRFPLNSSKTSKRFSQTWTWRIKWPFSFTAIVHSNYEPTGTPLSFVSSAYQCFMTDSNKFAKLVDVWVV